MRSSPLLPIFLIVAVDVLGLTIMIPLLPFYAEKLGASPFEVGWLIGIYAMRHEVAEGAARVHDLLAQVSAAPAVAAR